MTNAQMIAHEAGVSDAQILATDVRTLSTTELRAYREDLADLDAEHGGTRYLIVLESVELVLAERDVVFNPYL